MSGQCTMGVIGLGVMGANLALNIEEHGHSVAVWNRHYEATRNFLGQHAGKKLTGAEPLADFVKNLALPRRILLMVKSGKPVDEMILQLLPLLAKGDILIDGGNSFFKDTIRREEQLQKQSIYFLGMGVSGGEEGARHGPSLMPGGPRQAFETMRPILEDIAAVSDSGPCVAFLGPDGAGHFVKLVHNAIEYAFMQILAEAYDIMSRGLGLEAAAMASVFAEWNSGVLESFLMDLTARVLTVVDRETGRPLVEMVLDEAGQKGTGRWSAQEALDLGVPVPTIMAALFARNMSSMKAERIQASAILPAPATRPYQGDRAGIIKALRGAVTASTICAYAEGMELIVKASRQYDWRIDLSETARIWKGGCIIRARLLDPIMGAFTSRPDLTNLLLDDGCLQPVIQARESWRLAVKTGIDLSIPVPAMAASLAYFDSYRTAELPQNLTQAQRDAFGSHTYKRKDRPDAGPVHTDWL